MSSSNNSNDIDLNSLGYRELQSLAKKYHIKANQKLTQLRDQLGVALAAKNDVKSIGASSGSSDECENDENENQAAANSPCVSEDSENKLKVNKTQSDVEENSNSTSTLENVQGNIEPHINDSSKTSVETPDTPAFSLDTLSLSNDLPTRPSAKLKNDKINDNSKYDMNNDNGIGTSSDCTDTLLSDPMALPDTPALPAAVSSSFCDLPATEKNNNNNNSNNNNNNNNNNNSNVNNAIDKTSSMAAPNTPALPTSILPLSNESPARPPVNNHNNPTNSRILQERPQQQKQQHQQPPHTPKLRSFHRSRLMATAPRPHHVPHSARAPQFAAAIADLQHASERDYERVDAVVCALGGLGDTRGSLVRDVARFVRNEPQLAVLFDSEEAVEKGKRHGVTREAEATVEDALGKAVAWNRARILAKYSIGGARFGLTPQEKKLLSIRKLDKKILDDQPDTLTGSSNNAGKTNVSVSGIRAGKQPMSQPRAASDAERRERGERVRKAMALERRRRRAHGSGLRRCKSERSLKSIASNFGRLSRAFEALDVDPDSAERSSGRSSTALKSSGTRASGEGDEEEDGDDKGGGNDGVSTSAAEDLRDVATIVKSLDFENEGDDRDSVDARACDRGVSGVGVRAGGADDCGVRSSDRSSVGAGTDACAGTDICRDTSGLLKEELLELPPNWERRVSTRLAVGLSYYRHVVSGEVSWSFPAK